MKRLANVHAGEILRHEFLKPLGINLEQLAKDLNLPHDTLCHIVEGRGRITADIALRLSKYFGNTAKFWLGIQADYDIEEQKASKALELSAIRHFQNNIG